MKPLIADLYLALLHVLDLAWLHVRKPNNELALFNLLFSVAITVQPTTVLELGTGSGLSSLAFIRALQYWNKRVKGSIRVLHTCDMNPVVLRPLKRYGAFVVPHAMSTDELAAQWVQHPIPIDLLYIDADHSHQQSLADFETFSQYVVPNGLVLMHDTFPLFQEHEQLGYSGTVWKTAQFIKEHYRDEFEIMTIPYLCGVSLLRKKGAKYF